jgi:hypothetical protein
MGNSTAKALEGRRCEASLDQYPAGPVHYVWRGHKIRTPYFAAIGFGSTGKGSSSGESSPSERLDAMGMLDALAFYKIPGWTKDPEK